MTLNCRESKVITLQVEGQAYYWIDSHPVAIAYTKFTGHRSWAFRDYLVDDKKGYVFFFEDCPTEDGEIGQVTLRYGGKYSKLANSLVKPK